MWVHLTCHHHDVVDPEPALYTIRVNGHLGPTALSAFPAMVSHRHALDTVLTGHLDQSALYGVLAEVEVLGLELLEVHKLTPTRHREGRTNHLKPVTTAHLPDGQAVPHKSDEETRE
jgi:hypothetical protein